MLTIKMMVVRWKEWKWPSEQALWQKAPVGKRTTSKKKEGTAMVTRVEQCDDDESYDELLHGEIFVIFSSFAVAFRVDFERKRAYSRTLKDLFQKNRPWRCIFVCSMCWF